MKDAPLSNREIADTWRAAAAGFERNGDVERARAARKAARLAERRDRIGARVTRRVAK